MGNRKSNSEIRGDLEQEGVSYSGRLGNDVD